MLRPSRARRRAAVTAERTVDRNEVDERAAGAQVHEAQVVAAPLEGQPSAAVEADHPLEVPHAEDDVVDVPDLDHGWPPAARAARRRGRGGSVRRRRSRPKSPLKSRQTEWM